MSGCAGACERVHDQAVALRRKPHNLLHQANRLRRVEYVAFTEGACIESAHQRKINRLIGFEIYAKPRIRLDVVIGTLQTFKKYLVVLRDGANGRSDRCVSKE